MRARLGPRSRISLSLAIALAASSAGWASPAAGQQQTESKQHVVRKGDTLWDIARAYLMNPFLWPSIFEANRQVVEDPHWIYPDERLVIPPVVADAAAAAPAPVQRPVDDPSYASGPALQPPGRTMFYKAPVDEEPRRQGMRVVLDDQQTRAIVSPAEFHSAPWLSDTLSLNPIGRLVRLADPSLEQGRLTPSLHPFQEAFVGRLQRRDVVAGDTLLVVRLGREVWRGEHIIDPVALLEVESVGSLIAVRLVHQYARTELGDVVIDLPPAPAPREDRPQAVSGGPEGRILGFVERETIYATTDRAFIDLGSAQGLAPGDELLAFVPPETSERHPGEQMPERDIATLRVVRVAPNTATVRVLDVENIQLDEGMQVRVVRKMP